MRYRPMQPAFAQTGEKGLTWFCRPCEAVAWHQLEPGFVPSEALAGDEVQGSGTGVAVVHHQAATLQLIPLLHHNMPSLVDTSAYRKTLIDFIFPEMLGAGA